MGVPGGSLERPYEGVKMGGRQIRRKCAASGSCCFGVTFRPNELGSDPPVRHPLSTWTRLRARSTPAPSVPELRRVPDLTLRNLLLGCLPWPTLLSANIVPGRLLLHRPWQTMTRWIRRNRLTPVTGRVRPVSPQFGRCRTMLGELSGQLAVVAPKLTELTCDRRCGAGVEIPAMFGSSGKSPITPSETTEAC